MRTHYSFKSLIVLSVLILSAGSAWCSRADKGASNYGDMALGCPIGAGSATPNVGIAEVSCFSPQSSLTGTATILELYVGTTVIPSVSMDVNFPDGDPTDTMTFGGNFGLITCDANGSTVPCTPVSTTTNLITSGNDLVIQAGSPDSTTLTLSNVEGFLALYFTSPTFVTNVVANSTPSATPEPSSLALLGFGMSAIAFSLVRRGKTKRRSL